jgi:hypothetical protein
MSTPAASASRSKNFPMSPMLTNALNPTRMSQTAKINIPKFRGRFMNFLLHDIAKGYDLSQREKTEHFPGKQWQYQD